MGLLSGDDLVSLAVAMAIFLLLVDLMHRRQRWAPHYPPGPMALPGLGNLLQVDFRDPRRSYHQLRRRYGDVFSLQLAWTPVVVLNGLAAVREALVTCGEDTADRPHVATLEHLGFGPGSQGVIMAPYGQAWREQRRFSMSMLRTFGLGKKSLEHRVTEEATCLCAAFADHAGRPFSPSVLLNKAVGNVIASLTFGRRFEYDDPRFLRLLHLTKTVLEADSGTCPRCGLRHCGLEFASTEWEKDLQEQPRPQHVAGPRAPPHQGAERGPRAPAHPGLGGQGLLWAQGLWGHAA